MQLATANVLRTLYGLTRNKGSHIAGAPAVQAARGFMVQTSMTIWLAVNYVKGKGMQSAPCKSVAAWHLTSQAVQP